MLALSYAAVVIGAYLVAEVAGYITHALAHLRCTGPLYRSHMRHHVRYSPGNFIGTGYVSDGFGVWYVPAFVLATATVLYLLPIGMAIAAIFVFAAVSYANDTLHDSYHVAGHWLSKYRWHRRLRALHYVHHRHVLKNLGIYSFTIDMAVGRFKDYDAGAIASIGEQLSVITNGWPRPARDARPRV